MIKIIKRILILCLSLLLVIGGWSAAFADEPEPVDSEVSLDESHVEWDDDASAYSYSMNGQTHMYRDMYIGNSVAYCADPDQNDFPHTMYDETILGNSGRDLLIKALLMIGPGGKYYTPQGVNGISIFGKGSWFISSEASARRIDQLLIHFAIGRVVHGAFSGKVAGDMAGFLEELIGNVQGVLNNEKALLTANAKAATGYFGFHSSAFASLQNLVWLESQPDVNIPGALKVVKKSLVGADCVVNNANYSLSGAEFVIYSDMDRNNQVGHLTTNENGESEYLENLKAGNYYIEEVKPSKGYKAVSGLVPVSVGDGEEKTVEIIEPVEGDPVGIEILKVDKLGRRINFEGTEFTAVYSFKGNDGDAKRFVYVYRTDKEGRINMSDPSYLVEEKSDAPYLDELGTIQFFAGHINVKETRAPSGYYIDENLEINIDLTVDADGLIHMAPDYGSSESEALKVFIVNEEAVETFASDPATGTRVASLGEEVIVEDKVIVHGAKGLEINVSGYPVFAKDYCDINGNQFYAGDAVPYDQEQSVNFLQGFGESRREEFVLKYVLDTTAYSGAEICFFADVTYGDESCLHHDLFDENEIVRIPAISTQARDEQTGSNMGSKGSGRKIVDAVAVSGLIPDLQYIIKGYAVSRDDPEKIITPVMEKEFVALESDGTIEMEFELDTDKLNGRTIVFFEELYLNDVLVAAHRDPESNEQSVYYPAIATEMTNSKTNAHSVKKGETVSITDNVSYENLSEGETYILKAVLMDKSKNQAIKDKTGNEITAEKEFTASEANGNISMEFAIKESEFLPEEIVCFEYLYIKDGEVLVASHEDINSKEQSVRVNEPETTTPETTLPETTTVPPSDTPKTGDRAAGVRWAVICGCMFLAIAGIVVIKVKETKGK